MVEAEEPDTSDGVRVSSSLVERAAEGGGRALASGTPDRMCDGGDGILEAARRGSSSTPDLDIEALCDVAALIMFECSSLLSLFLLSLFKVDDIGKCVVAVVGVAERVGKRVDEVCWGREDGG